MRLSMRSSPEVPVAARARRLLGLVLPAAALLVAVAACGAGSRSIVVSDAWVRAPTGTGSLTAAYVTITNGGATDDTLLSVSSPAATMAMVHQSTTDPSGLTAMLPVSQLVVPAGGTVTFQPGGYHVMLDGIPPETAVGSTIELDLVFEHAGRITVQATVRSG
jgi:copper(I)-binding protein